MIIIFEGCRNSGKTFLGNKISENLNIPRFQFDFSKYFSELGLTSKNDRSSQAFSISKDLMLLQLNRDGFIKNDCIVDRGFLTVLAWGILENRINVDEAFSQFDLLHSSGLLNDIVVIYIHGENPNKRSSHKDQWDEIEKSDLEKRSYETILNYSREKDLNINLIRFENNFTDESITELSKIIENVRNFNK